MKKIWILAFVASGCIGWLAAGGQQSELQAYNSTGNTVILSQGDRMYIVNTETQVFGVYDTSKRNSFLGGRRYDYDLEYIRLKGEVPLVQNGLSVQGSANGIGAVNRELRRKGKKG